MTTNGNTKSTWLAFIFTVLLPMGILLVLPSHLALSLQTYILIAFIPAFAYLISCFWQDRAARKQNLLVSLSGIALTGITALILLFASSKPMLLLREALIPTLIMLAIIGLRLRGHSLSEKFLRPRLAPAVLAAYAQPHREHRLPRLFRLADFGVFVLFFLSLILNLSLGVLLINGAPESLELTQSYAVFQTISTPLLIGCNIGISVLVTFLVLKRMNRETGIAYDDLFDSTKPSATATPAEK